MDGLMMVICNRQMYDSPLYVPKLISVYTSAVTAKYINPRRQSRPEMFSYCEWLKFWRDRSASSVVIFLFNGSALEFLYFRRRVSLFEYALRVVVLPAQ